MENLQSFIPLTHAALRSSLKEYARPNDKIAYLMEKGTIQAITKGKYITKEAIQNNLFLMHQSANILYGPSYISRYSALSFYGLLAETTTIIESMTLKRSKIHQNNFGTFQYYSQPLSSVFATGVESKNIGKNGSILLASPIKAICDIIWTTPNLLLTSVADLIYFLEEDIRLEIEPLANADMQMLAHCLQFGKKKKELELLQKLILSLK